MENAANQLKKNLPSDLNFIICAPDDSAAHLFAMHNGIPFFILMDYPE